MVISTGNDGNEPGNEGNRLFLADTMPEMPTIEEILESLGQAVITTQDDAVAFTFLKGINHDQGHLNFDYISPALNKAVKAQLKEEGFGMLFVYMKGWKKRVSRRELKDARDQELYDGFLKQFKRSLQMQITYPLMDDIASFTHHGFIARAGVNGTAEDTGKLVIHNLNQILQKYDPKAKIDYRIR